MSDARAAVADSLSPPSVLLAEDDETSRHFLTEALRQLGCQVDACVDGAAAAAWARRRHFDVLLLDCHMPGGGAVQILAQLRAEPQAASRASAAIASSAELDPASHAQLLRSGFSGVLLKPASLKTLQVALETALAAAADGSSGWFDDRAALRSSGNAETVRALRMLFDDELRHLLQDLDDLVRTPDRFGERLHRLLASCGFCGATGLALHARQLLGELRGNGVLVAAAVAAFRDALVATLTDLDARQAGSGT
ncbi:MAG TPA: response regulator [Rhodanobacteraceae bacterium]|nr:response regulator [Rhodanobacteraceae bacterium]